MILDTVHYLEVFKSKYIQYSDKSHLVLTGVRALVDRIHQPGKCSGVKALCHCMAILTSLWKEKKTNSFYNSLVIVEEWHNIYEPLREKTDNSDINTK
jgi:hypothetical protein